MKHLETFETLLKEHGKLQAILESTTNGILEMDLEGQLFNCNPAAKKILGIHCMDGNYPKIQEALPLESIQDIIKNLIQKRHEVLLNSCQVEVEDATGKHEKFLELKFFSLPQWEVQYIILIITDKTDVIRALQNREHFITTLINLVDELKVDNREIIYNLAKLAEIRDAGTGKHLERVEAFTKTLASEYQRHYAHADSRITDEYVEDMAISSVLHDIGKIGISDVILQKPGKLEPHEFEVIKEHTFIAGQALLKHRGKKDYLAMGREISLNHHEKWDGTGYPNGKKGEEIPLSGRIVALCDVYDALTTQRPYKQAFSHERAVEIIKTDRGRAFDPRITDLFLNIETEFDKIRKDFAE